MTTCFPSRAPTQCGKFHLSLNLISIAFHCSSVDGNCRHKALNSDNMASHTSRTMYEMAVLLTRNWNSRERNVSPVARNLKLRLVFLRVILENAFLCSFWRSLGLSPQPGGERGWRPYACNVWTMGGLQPPILLRCLYRTLSPLFFSANLYLGLSFGFLHPHLHLRRPNKLLSYTK